MFLAHLSYAVTACDMAHTPLEKSSVDVAVFSLVGECQLCSSLQSLMGTNFAEYLAEAHRVLKKSGLLRVAEVSSPVESVTCTR